MKISTLLFFLSVFVVNAENLYPQQKELSLNLKNVTLQKAIAEIEKSSDYVFLITDEAGRELNKRTTLRVTNESIHSILEKMLKGTSLGYSVVERQVSLYKDTESKASEKPVTVTEEITQQKKSITGRITDEEGIPLIGANVVEVGTTNGTVTDIDGNFTLSVADDAVLQISYIGYLTQEINTAGRTNINIVLQEETIGLDEFVAVGYGTVRRRDLTGSVSSVSGNTLKDIPVTSAAQAIAGRMPGVQVTKTEGSPDADIKIRVRGGGSITQDNSPLFIVDGFPVDNINDIAPTDIESIDVLKDASSTAIYGARGANGVIIVTTKGGTEGNGKVYFNTYYGIKKIAKTLDVLSPYEYVFWQYELLNSSPRFPRLFGDFRDMDIYKEMKGTDWQNEILGRTGTSLYNNISFTGGTKTARYNISLTRNDEEEIMIGSGYSRTNLTVKTSYNIKSWLKADLSSRLSDLRLKGTGTGVTDKGETNSRLPHIIQYRPVEGFSEFIDYSVIEDEDGGIPSTYTRNPLLQTMDDYRRLNQFIVNVNGALELSFSKSLMYRLELGVQSTESEEDRFFGLNTTNVWNYGEQPLASIREGKITAYRMANTLTFTKKNFLPGNNFSFMAGEELNTRKTKYVTSSAKYFPKYIEAKYALNMMNLGTADPIVTLTSPDTNISSYFSRLNYDYKGRYLFSATFRADGSSKFAKGNQWGYFPSVALAWRISDENFMVQTEKWLSNLKLRTSYGESGNNRIADDSWRKVFSINRGNIFLDGESTPTAYIVPEGVLSNPRLKWETTITRNVGLDFGLFRQRLSGSFELYKNTTRDLLIRTSIPSSTGYTTQYQNIGQTSNKGLEITLEGIIVKKRDFTLSASFNIGFNRNKIDELGEVKSWEESSGWASADGPTGDYLIEEGKPVGLMYGYQTDGYYGFDDFDYNDQTKSYTLKEGVADNSGLTLPQLFWPGMPKFVNQDDDPLVNASDKIVIGNAFPVHTGGFSVTSRFKGLDFSAFFNWVYGNDVYNANKLNFTNYQSARAYKNLLNIMNSDNRFTYYSQETGLLISDPAELAEMNKNKKIWSSAYRKTQLHSWAVEDGSFLRLNNITIGYSIPSRLLQKIGMEQLRIYITGYNLWTWTNYSGYDPEVDTRRSTPMTPGVDWCAYPRSRTFNIGLNVTL